MVQVRRVVIAAMVVGVLFVPAQAAAGGGWWSFIHVDRSPVAIGETVEVRATEVLFETVAEAKRAQWEEEYFVYLVRGYDRSVLERAMTKAEPGDWWSVDGAELVRVGRVELGASGGNLVGARASFRVPDVAPGTYALMLCDAGCVRPLANVLPTRGFTIVADPTTARLARRLALVEERLARVRLSRLDERVLVARAETAAVRSELEELRAETDVLRRQAAAASAPRWTFAGWVVAGIALAGVVAALLRRRRSLEPSHEARDSWRVTDEELGEILSARGRADALAEPIRRRR